MLKYPDLPLNVWVPISYKCPSHMDKYNYIFICPFEKAVCVYLLLLHIVEY